MEWCCLLHYIDFRQLALISSAHSYMVGIRRCTVEGWGGEAAYKLVVWGKADSCYQLMEGASEKVLMGVKSLTREVILWNIGDIYWQESLRNQGVCCQM